jgi:hypothetical protein
MSAQTKPCQGQHENLIAWTEPLPYPTRAYKLLWQLWTRGLREALGTAVVRVRRFLADRRRGTQASKPRVCSPVEALNLQPGEMVRVKSESEILATLDSCGRGQGLAWMPCMSQHCGQEYRVYKRVEKLILESTGEIRKARNTVLLEGVICEGIYGCSRSCFPFWREVWLERVPVPDEASGASSRRWQQSETEAAMRV